MIASRYKDNTYGKNIIPYRAQAIPKLHHGTYGHLLFDKRWRNRRLQILSRDGNSCVICRGNENLQIHHRQYQFVKALGRFKAPWDYEDRLLITLCERCHSKGHNRYKVPTVIV